MNKIKIGDILYELDNENFTAKIIHSNKVKDDVFIPKSITYDSHNYIIKCIAAGSFADNHFLQSIEFSNDSELETIEKNAFALSSLEKIIIPASITNLEDGWCKNIRELTQISISPLNRRYSYVGKKFIVGKTNELSDVFDILIFARRDIKKAVIPSYIKYITSYAFSECYELESISLNQNLISIGIEAFSFTLLSNISIPKHLKELKEGWCRGNSQLNQISISQENDHFLYIDEKMIVGKSDEKSGFFDVLYFVRRDIPDIFIPSCIKYIYPYALSECYKIKNVNFYEDSELISIGKCAFMSSSIFTLYIPSKVEIFEEGWCRNTTNLTKVIISEKNKNFKIQENFYILGKKD